MKIALSDLPRLRELVNESYKGSMFFDCFKTFNLKSIETIDNTYIIKFTGVLKRRRFFHLTASHNFISFDIFWYNFSKGSLMFNNLINDSIVDYIKTGIKINTRTNKLKKINDN